MSAAESRGPRDSFRIPAEHYLSFSEEHWMPLSLAGLPFDALSRIADQTTEVFFVTLISGPHKGVQLVGMRSLARFIARRGVAQHPGKALDISHVLAGLKDT